MSSFRIGLRRLYCGSLRRVLHEIHTSVSIRAGLHIRALRQLKEVLGSLPGWGG
jgi:hypothetical protein